MSQFDWPSPKDNCALREIFPWHLDFDSKSKYSQGMIRFLISIFAFQLFLFHCSPAFSERIHIAEPNPDSTRPSPSSCEFYLHLEEQLQCGADGYFQQVYPLCLEYLQNEKRLTKEIQDFFPRVRLCLQSELLRLGSKLKCQSLDSVVIDSHLKCYTENEYCELSVVSKAQLAWLTLPSLESSLWRATAAAILNSCKPKE